MTRVQLHRGLSKLGLCSRRQAQAVIREGGVTVNGRITRTPLAWVDLDADRIEVMGQAPEAPPLVCLKMHKPKAVVTSRQDERDRRTVYDLLPQCWQSSWLFPVGRLDRDSEGLLLFTNDGALGQALTLPENHVPKCYRVRLNRFPDPAGLDQLRQGLTLAGESLLPAEVEAAGHRWLEIQIYEGKNRQVRRMFQAIGCRVERLIRVAIGPIVLNDLAPGACRALSGDELRKLKAAAGIR